MKVGKEALGKGRRFSQKRTAIFTLGDEAVIVEAEFFPPADEVVKIDVSGEILPPGESIEIRARDTLMMVVATDGSGGFAVINFVGSSSVIYGEKVSCLPVGQPVFQSLAAARMDLKNEFLPVALAFSKDTNGKSVHKFVGEDEGCAAGCLKRVFHRGVESHRAPEFLS